MTAPAPCPFASSQSMIVALASATSRPFRSSPRSGAALLIAGPSPVYALPSKPSGGATVRTIGSSKASAKSQSRSSWPGTAMIAPVP